MSELRVGVVGIGNNGIHHAKAYWLHERAQLVGMCDFDRAKLDHAREWIGTDDRCGLYTSLEEMLEKADLDALSVNTSDHLHAGPFVQGLEAGCHVIVEKPMGNTMDDLHMMTEAARASDRKTMVGQILRFNPYNVEVHRLCSSGELGDIFYLEADYIHALQGQADASRINPYIGNVNWYLEHEKVLVGGCSHQFDLLRWYSNSYAVEVMGYGNSIAFPQMKHPDCMCAVAKMSSGAICKLTGAYGVVGPRPEFNNLEILGTRGTVRGGKIMRGEGHEAVVEDISSRQIEGHPYEPEIDHFIGCILEDQPTIVDAFEGANSAAGMIMATEAVETGKVLSVPHFVR
jgi:UDP-N-acetylglucosamine 3-dehydrogenase